ncbi:hypothetical protein HDU96_005136 [Phlyctochytrium bullatum]|nr:hypothetical protein HDU96_005136 [Phlyctochytrium bullatum]
MGPWTKFLLTFALGGIFTVVLLVVGAVLVFRSLPERVSKLQGKKRRGRGKRGGAPGLKGSASVDRPPYRSDGDLGGPGAAAAGDDLPGKQGMGAASMQEAAYDPQLTKVGWMRIATRPLTTDELYMDGFGNPGEWFLDGLAVRPTATETLPGESLSSLPKSVKRKPNLVSNIASMSETAVSIVEASLQTTSYLLSRFMGETPPLPPIAVAPRTVDNPYKSRPPWRNVFAVLKHKTLFIYSSDERLECLDIILLTEFRVDLYPEHLRDSQLYLRETPIRLRLRGSVGKKGDPDATAASTADNAPAATPGLYLYTASGSDKEDWLFMLRRASHLPPNADTGALSVHFQETEPMRHFTDAMAKLKTTVENLEGAEGHATAWLNALVGRAFVGLHANPHVKEWVINKLSRRYTRARGSSILGDIVIQDLYVGDSIPVLSNPKLLGFSSEGDVNVEVDIDYTGGVRVEAATIATVSVSAFEPYVKPLQIPLVVAIKVKRFSARVLIKIKPFWETSRVWVGFYRDPGLKLELDVEPIISNKLIRLQVVNQIIERRIKEALEELVVLPNMDDFSFWPSDGKGGIFWDDEEDEDGGGEGEEDYEDAEDGYGEDENTAYADDPLTFGPDEMGRSSKRSSTAVGVALDEDHDSEGEHTDPETLYRRLQQKYTDEALRAQEAEARWFAETAGLSDDDEHGGSEIGDEGGSLPMPEEGTGSVIIGDDESDGRSQRSASPLVPAPNRPHRPSLSSSFKSRAPSRLSIESESDPDDHVATPRQPLSIVTTAANGLPVPPAPSSADSGPPSSTSSSSAPAVGGSGAATPGSSSTSSSAASERPPSAHLSRKPRTPTMAVFEYLGETAEYAGRKSREYGLDEMARSLSETASLYGSTLKQKTALLSDRTLAYFGYARIGRDGGRLALIGDGGAGGPGAAAGDGAGEQQMQAGAGAATNIPVPEVGPLSASYPPYESFDAGQDDDHPTIRPRSRLRSRPPSLIAEEASDVATPRNSVHLQRPSRPQTPDETASQAGSNKGGSATKNRPPSILEMLGVNITTAAPEQKPLKKQKRRAFSINSNNGSTQQPGDGVDLGAPTEFGSGSPAARANSLRGGRGRPKSRGSLVRRSMDDLRGASARLPSWGSRNSPAQELWGDQDLSDGDPCDDDAFYRSSYFDSETPSSGSRSSALGLELPPSGKTGADPVGGSFLTGARTSPNRKRFSASILQSSLAGSMIHGVSAEDLAQSSRRAKLSRRSYAEGFGAGDFFAQEPLPVRTRRKWFSKHEPGEREGN